MAGSANHRGNSGPPALVDMRGITKRFGELIAVDGVDLSIRQGEFLTFLGPSGCGKTTLLRILAGFVEPDEGEIWLEDKDVTRVPPERRPLNMVFQNYALFPHMNTVENVAYGLRTIGRPDAETRQRVADVLSMVHLSDFATRKIGELSGGQQQRVALARALVLQPKVLLLDEPLAALDLKLRKRLQEELRSIQETLNTTFVFVTHDQDEALTLSDRVGLMSNGQLVQLGTPREIYDRPTSQFSAQFMGEANVIDCRVLTSRADRVSVKFANGAVRELQDCGGAGFQPGSAAYAVLRPENLEFSSTDPLFKGKVRRAIFRGTHVSFYVGLDGGNVIRMMTTAAASVTSGQEVGIDISAGSGVIVPRGDQDTDVAEPERVEAEAMPESAGERVL